VALAAIGLASNSVKHPAFAAAGANSMQHSAPSAATIHR
jgi:hypothetical protein